MNSQDHLQPYRQPMVTASGIILGFVLNFASGFVKSEPGVPDWVAYAVGVLVVAGVVCLIAVLARILRADVDPRQAGAYYRSTRLLFVAGVSLAVFGALVDMFGNFMSDPLP